MSTPYTAISAPLHMTINIVGNCNLDCVYCYEQPFNKETIPLPRVISLLEEMRERGVFVIKIAGGEPLLHPHIVEIVEYLVDQHYHAAILTNLAIKPLTVRRVAKALRGADWINFQVSLDSVDPRVNDGVRGGTDAVLSNIEILIEEQLDFQIATVITNRNIDSALQIIDHFTPRVRRFHFMNLMPTVKLPQGNGFEDYLPSQKKLVEFWGEVGRKKEILGEQVILTNEGGDADHPEQSCQYTGCTAGVTFCEIDSNLDVLACNIARPYVMGNLNAASFNEIWNGERSDKIRRVETALCKTRGQVDRFLTDPKAIPILPLMNSGITAGTRNV